MLEILFVESPRLIMWFFYNKEPLSLKLVTWHTYVRLVTLVNIIAIYVFFIIEFNTKYEVAKIAIPKD